MKLHGFEAAERNSVALVTQLAGDSSLSSCYKKVSFHGSCSHFQRCVVAKSAFKTDWKRRECAKLWANQSLCHSSVDFLDAAKVAELLPKDCGYARVLNCSLDRREGDLRELMQSSKASFWCLAIKKDLYRDFELLGVVSACFPLISPKLI